MTSELESEASSTATVPAARATALGQRLAGLLDDPERFVETLSAGLAQLADPAYAATLRRVSPDVETFYAVRAPIVRAIEAPIRGALQGSSSATALWLAAHLERAPVREVRLFTLPCLSRALTDEPERSWQVMRRLAARAEDWIEVDSLAQVWTVGIRAEPFRWAELEQLVYSSHAMERRLVGSTLATMARAGRRSDRAGQVADLAPRAVALIGTLIGDDEPAVQKALSWALRSWHALAPGIVESFLREQAELARSGRDGHRARVIRDASPAVPPILAAELFRRLGDIRRRPGEPSSSTAAAMVTRFGVGSGTLAAAGQGQRYVRAHR